MSAIEIELAVRNALAATCHAADEGATLDELTALMTEDVTWEMSSGTLQGRQGVAEGLQGARDRGLTGPGSQTYHLLTTVAVTADAEAGTAGSRSGWLLVRGGAEPSLLMVGEYVDEWVWRDGTAWLRARRVVRR